MTPFRIAQPTEVLFGRGRAQEVGTVVQRYGNRCLLVSGPAHSTLAPVYARLTAALTAAGVDVVHFDGVEPNPTTGLIAAGAEAARRHGATVVLGVGGGSSIDTAKAIAVEATHEGSAWDYRYCSDRQPGPATLPIVALPTTAGTGAHVTQVSVLTNPDLRDKSALYHDAIFPRVAIVDPDLTVTAPPFVTACTGFDVLTHAFESCLHPASSPWTTPMAVEAIGLVARHLPTAVRDGHDMEARTQLAWADTLAGLCIASAGVTLPHGIGMAIGGMYPHVAHGQALAVIYPAIAQYTWDAAVKPYAMLARLLDPSLTAQSAEQAAEASRDAIHAFLAAIGLATSLDALRVPRVELSALADQSLVLPDYKGHPRVASRADVLGILEDSFAN